MLKSLKYVVFFGILIGYILLYMIGVGFGWTQEMLGDLTFTSVFLAFLWLIVPTLAVAATLPIIIGAMLMYYFPQYNGLVFAVCLIIFTLISLGQLALRWLARSIR